MRENSALGFAPHSGWAVVVSACLDAGRPSILFRGRIEMADEKLKGSKQPYHSVEPLIVPLAQRRLTLLSASAASKAVDGIGKVVEALRDGSPGSTPRVAGILDGSGRTPNDLAAILASHALIHTADGEHFRTALEQACHEHAIEVVRVKRRELVERAVSALDLPASELRDVVRDVGKKLGAPWGADQKSAALLAWLLAAECER